jgi:hypothetical protein
MRFPDICGYKMKNAEKLLKEQGIDNYIVTLTAPPRLRDRGYDEESRIVKQRVTDEGKLELIVSNVIHE